MAERKGSCPSAAQQLKVFYDKILPPPFSQASQRQPPLPGVRQVLRERGLPPQAPRLPPGNGDAAGRISISTEDVALLRLHRRIHARGRAASTHGADEDGAKAPGERTRRNTIQYRTSISSGKKTRLAENSGFRILHLDSPKSKNASATQQISNHIVFSSNCLFTYLIAKRHFRIFSHLYLLLCIPVRGSIRPPRCLRASC